MRNPEPEAPFLRPNPTLKESGYLEAHEKHAEYHHHEKLNKVCAYWVA